MRMSWGNSVAKIATVFGGSGFVGRYVVRALARSGWRVRAATRRPNEAIFLRTYGTPGQVEPVPANVREPASVEAAMRDCEAVVNCVGILVERGAQTFLALHQNAAGTIAQCASDMKVQHLVHISAIGADRDSESRYARSKALGEEAVRDAFPTSVVLRPSIIFGAEDAFFNRFAAMTSMSPILPLVGAKTRFQPVYVNDVAQAAMIGASGEARAGLYELGGPDRASFRELMQRMLEVIGRRRLILDIPAPLARPLAGTLDVVQFASGGLVANTLLTVDQIWQLQRDNVVSDEAAGLAELGIEPTSMEAILASYLGRFSPPGQGIDPQVTP